jgi:hypothetical protein
MIPKHGNMLYINDATSDAPFTKPNFGTADNNLYLTFLGIGSLFQLKPGMLIFWPNFPLLQI